MLKYLLIGSTLLLSMGCAHMGTIHQYCSDPDNAEKYDSYEQCYAEERAYRQRRHEYNLQQQRINAENQRQQANREAASVQQSYQPYQPQQVIMPVQQNISNKRTCTSSRNVMGEVETTCQDSY